MCLKISIDDTRTTFGAITFFQKVCRTGRMFTRLFSPARQYCSHAAGRFWVGEKLGPQGRKAEKWGSGRACEGWSIEGGCGGVYGEQQDYPLAAPSSPNRNEQSEKNGRVQKEWHF